MGNDDFTEEDWADVSADLEQFDRQDADECDGEPCRCGFYDCPECGTGEAPEWEPDGEEFEEDD